MSVTRACTAALGSSFPRLFPIAEYGGHGGPAHVPSTLSHCDISSSKMSPVAPILKTAPGSGGPCSLNSGIAISRSMSKAYLTMYGPGHLISAMAALHASRPTQGMAKVIPRPSVGMPPTRRGQSAQGNPAASIGNSPAAHDANAMAIYKPRNWWLTGWLARASNRGSQLAMMAAMSIARQSAHAAVSPQTPLLPCELSQTPLLHVM